MSAALPYVEFESVKYDLVQTLHVGRSDKCHIRLPHNQISRLHAIIVPSPTGCYAIDMNSKNGIAVNDEFCKNKSLSDGDVITIGDYSMRFHDPDAAKKKSFVRVGDMRRVAPALKEKTVKDTDTINLPIIGGSHRSADLIDRAITEDILSQPRTTERTTDRLAGIGRIQSADPAERLLSLYNLSRVIQSYVSRKDLADRILFLTADVLGADSGLFLMPNKVGDLKPHTFFSRGKKHKLDTSLHSFVQVLAGKAGLDADPLIVGPPIRDDRFRTIDGIAALEITSAMIAPMTTGEDHGGFLYVDRRVVEQPFRQSDLKMLVAIGAQAHLAITNSSLFQELEASLERIEQQQQALIQSEKLAAMGLLSAGVGHEIRNPLSVVQGNLDLLALDTPPADTKHLIAIAQKAACRIGDISKGLLNLAHRKGGQKTTLFSPADVIEEVSSIVATTGTLRKKYNVELECTSAAVVAKVQGDRTGLVQVLMNLILNAAQALDGGGKITVNVVTMGDRVRVKVCDTGPGVPPDLRATLFEPFCSRKEGGTGLGLWISRLIVERMGGSLGYESGAGDVGAVFTLSLPAAEATLEP